MERTSMNQQKNEVKHLTAPGTYFATLYRAGDGFTKSGSPRYSMCFRVVGRPGVVPDKEFEGAFVWENVRMDGAKSNAVLWSIANRMSKQIHADLHVLAHRDPDAFLSVDDVKNAISEMVSCKFLINVEANGQWLDVRVCEG